jgi:DNA-binding FadR family transcriptional regulator
MRAALAADIARLCALRASPELRQKLVAMAEEIDRTTDEQTLFMLEVLFWDRVIDGAKNSAYRLSFNSLLRGVLAIGERGKKWCVSEYRRSAPRMRLARAIADGDADRAEADTRATYRATAEEFAAENGLSCGSDGADPELSSYRRPNANH